MTNANDMTIFDAFDYLCNELTYEQQSILDFAVSEYGMNDETLGNITYYFYGIDDVYEFIENNESEKNEN